MSMEYLGLAAAVVVTCALLFFFRRESGGNRTASLPPGPKGWPVIGSMGQLSRLPHRDFYRLSQQYGPLMFMHLGTTPTVVVSSVDMAREILKTHDRVFCSRPDLVTSTIFSYGQKDIAWAPYGSHWRFVRKLCAMELFSNTQISDFQETRTEEVLDMLNAMLDESKDGKTVRIKYHLKVLIANHITQMLGSKRFFGLKAVDAASASEFQSIIGDIFKIIGDFNLSDYWPFFKRFDLQGYGKQMRIKRDRFSSSFTEKLIEEYHKKDKHSANRTFVDILLSLDPESTKSDDGESIDVNIITRTIILDVLSGGIDTSSTHLEWTMAELLRNPDIMKKAQNELDSIVGRERLVEESDIVNLPYLQAIIKESFRLRPVVPMLLPRESLEACTVGGYYVPPKTRVFVSTWAIGRDPARWEDPLKFNPERFLDKAVDFRGADFDLLPFGAGRRICPGMNLGLAMINLALASMLHAIEWELPPGQSPEDVDMEESFTVTLIKTVPLVASAKPRLPVPVLK